MNIQGYNNVGAIITDHGTSMAVAYTSAALTVIELAYIKSNLTVSASAIDLAVVNAITHVTDAIGITGIFAAQLAA